MDNAEDNHQDHCLKERQEQVRYRHTEKDDAQDGGGTTLKDGIPDDVQGVNGFLVWRRFIRGDEAVGDMHRKVYWESDAQNQVRHGDEIDVDVPERHAANDADLDASSGGGHPQGAEDVRYEEQRHEEHANDGNDHVLQSVGPDDHGLVEVDERLVEDRHPEVADFPCDPSRLQHSVLSALKPSQEIVK